MGALSKRITIYKYTLFGNYPGNNKNDVHIF